MKKVILFIFSLFGWSVILYFLAPIITTISWVIYSLFLYRKLFIKQELKGTLYALLILLIISIFYYIILKIWSLYNYKRYYIKNKRKVYKINFEYKSLDFKKIELSGEEIDDIIKSFCDKNYS